MEFNIDAVAVYSEFGGQLAELKELNQSLVFDYEDAKQNKEARSHCAKLRKVKSAIEDRRKTAKADALEYGRALDSRAKELASEVDLMIDVHMQKIVAIENREKERAKQVDDFLATLDVVSFSTSTQDLEARIKHLSEYAVDQGTFLDRTEFTEYRRTQTLEQLKVKLADVKQQIAERAELEELRREKELFEKRKADDEAHIRAQAQAQSLEEQAVRIRADEEKQRLAKAERDAQEARLNDERNRLAVERAALEQAQAEQRRLIAEEQARAADSENQRRVNAGILKSFESFGVDTEVAKQIIIAIWRGDIQNLRIKY